MFLLLYFTSIFVPRISNSLCVNTTNTGKSSTSQARSVCKNDSSLSLLASTCDGWALRRKRCSTSEMRKKHMGGDFDTASVSVSGETFVYADFLDILSPVALVTIETTFLECLGDLFSLPCGIAPATNICVDLVMVNFVVRAQRV